MDRFFKFLNSDRYQYTESEIYLESNMQNQIVVFDMIEIGRASCRERV